MTIAELLVPEFDQEMAATRKVLERVPDAKFGWKPHDKSYSMRDLASHIANMVTWTVDTMTKTEFNMAGVSPEEMNRAAKNTAELLSWFDANVAKAHAALQLRPQLLPESHRPSPRAARRLSPVEQRRRSRRVRSVR